MYEIIQHIYALGECIYIFYFLQTLKAHLFKITVRHLVRK